MNIAHNAKVVYKPECVIVLFKTDKGEISHMFSKRRTSWSHKKYVDKALKEKELHPSAFFTYGWDMTAL